MMIEYDYKPTEDMKLHSLSKWMEIDEKPSWSKVVKALVAISERHVARNIAEKYGKHVLLFYILVEINSHYAVCGMYIGICFPSGDTTQEKSATTSAVIESGVSVEHCGLVVAVMSLMCTAVGYRAEDDGQNG